jgi:nitroimidazol reductase NimA-like FMN-containing flavoprotein (pyridoxamine 5'-phosphate oxidase superfamily)
VVEKDRNGLEVLDRAECVRLLSGSSVGRVAVTVGALPVILPVNFLVDGERILIRTGEGTKLDAATRDAVVAFEVDHIEPFAHAGWSVCVTGIAREVDDEEERARVDSLPLPHWTPNGVSHIVAVSLELVSGRRIPRDPVGRLRST